MIVLMLLMLKAEWRVVFTAEWIGWLLTMSHQHARKEATIVVKFFGFLDHENIDTI
jgi:hypothetical protein